MRLSILVPALQSRPWRPLIEEIDRQIRHANADAEVLVRSDNGIETSGAKRQKLSNFSKGDYLAFLDDDDWVSPDYVASLYEATKSGSDVLTFDMDVRSLKWGADVWSFGLHVDDPNEGRMTANHLCAWRRDLARKVGWCPDIGYADDQLWYKPLHATGLVRTETHVPLPLYEYRYSQQGTTNQIPWRVRRSRRYVGRGLSCFWQGDEVFIEVGGGKKASQRAALVWGPDGRHHRIPLSRLRQFYVVRIK